MNALAQIGAVIGLNLQSLPQRFWMSAATVIAVALAVGVMLAFQSISAGFQATVRGSGSAEIAVISREGSGGSELNSAVSLDEMRILSGAPGVKLGPDGAPQMSGELYVIVDGRRKSGPEKVNLPLRGVGAAAAGFRDGFTITQGRMLQFGANELIVGEGVLEEFTGFEIGSVVRLGDADWNVVGAFTAPATVFDSEIWGDGAIVQNVFDRQGSVQTVRLRLDGPEGLQKLTDYVAADSRFNVIVETEADFFADQGGAVGFLAVVGTVLGVIMGIGSLAGALNTMFASVSARTREIATLRTIGFGGLSAFAGTFVESIVLALLGGLLGVGGAFLLFNGLTASTLGAGFTQVVFAFKVTPDSVVQGVGLALIIGVLGGLAPGLRAARAPLLAVNAA